MKYLVMKLHNAVGDVYRSRGGLWTKDIYDAKIYDDLNEATNDLRNIIKCNVDLPSLEIISDRVGWELLKMKTWKNEKMSKEIEELRNLAIQIEKYGTDNVDIRLTRLSEIIII